MTDVGSGMGDILRHGLAAGGHPGKSTGQKVMACSKMVFRVARALPALMLGASTIVAVPLQAQPHVAVSTPAPAPATLATLYQLGFEREVLRVVNSAPMQAEIARVEALYAADAQGATAAGKATLKRAAYSIAMAAAQYAVGEDTDRPGAAWTVNAPHDWHGLNVPRSGYGIDNPDNVYRNIMVDAAARYEIRGQVTLPGPAELHFEMRDAIPGTTDMAAEGGRQLSTLRSDQIVTDSDGRFVITVDNAPANGRANHLQTPETGHYLVIVRDLFTDWAAQRPVALEVQRVGGPAVHPKCSGDAVVARAVELLSKIAPYWVNYDNRFVYSRVANTLSPPRVRPGGRGMSGSGHFTLKPDEAWVITLDALGAVSLGVQLSDPWGVAYEYASRTSSLNGVQAKANADGTYTFVVSQRDPGVYNWLDPEGQPAGMLAIRWQSLPQGAKPESAIRGDAVVALKDLRASLPRETVFVSATERKAQQAARQVSYNRRVTE